MFSSEKFSQIAGKDTRGSFSTNEIEILQRVHEADPYYEV